MNIKVKLDEKDYISFSYWHIKNIYLFFYIFLGIMLLSWLYPLYISGKQLDRAGIISSLIAVIIFVAILIYLPISTKSRLKKLFASDKFLQLEQTYDITADSISVSSERSNTLVKWDEVYSLKESQDMFAIFLARNRAFLLPKRFMDDAAIQELRQLAIANLPTKKVKLRKI